MLLMIFVIYICVFFLCPQVTVTQTQLLSCLANDYAWFKKDKRSRRDSPSLQTLHFEWLGAALPLSWLAGEPVDGSTCTCLGCSGLWCNPCRRWPSSRCCPPCRPPWGERSGSRSHPSCSYRAGILDKPGRVIGSINQPFAFHYTKTKQQHGNCMQAAYLQLVCARVFLRGGAVCHGCQAGGTPRNQKGSTGQQLRH